MHIFTKHMVLLKHLFYISNFNPPSQITLPFPLYIANKSMTIDKYQPTSINYLISHMNIPHLAIIQIQS